MKKAQRQEWLAMLSRLENERRDFCAMLCNICRFMDCREADDWDCAHPLFRRRVPSVGVEAAVENGQQMDDCWLFVPRAECKTLELAEAFVRSGVVDARWYEWES